MENMIKIPEWMTVVSYAESGRLLEKQWRARIEMKRNCFARAMNVKWRMYFRDRT